MKTLPRLVFALCLAGALAASAQTSTPAPTTPMGPPRGGRGPGGPGGPGHGPRGHPIIRVLDADHDGEISAAELANASAAIRTLDANGDGNVTVEEMRAYRPAGAPTPPANAPTPPANRPTPPAGATPPARDGMGRPHPVDPIMLALDADGDGTLSSAEISNASKSLAALDLNKDGKLTRDELMPLPPAK